ncbi:unnamed protein product [Cuscuta campestris]|uniref:HMA domain-containing protein n=2 Tax=Cuscuta sect. Cleistogrammica TaxID=1824901 RepID=A0A484KFK8_9ASTE|nr:hypothetical protein DM860_016325 [Cuscuta australis]VFQ61967.1 unnamed protein product [Cuscuta campestris]
MGIKGTIDCISDVMMGSSEKKKMKKKRKQMQTVELKIRMDCTGCERKVKNALSSISGVESVEINRKEHKATVRGYVEPSKVLKKAKSTGKKAEIWPYVPYHLVDQPYAAGAYDRKAPPGYVRSLDPFNTHNNDSFDSYTYMFSDENPNACSIM